MLPRQRQRAEGRDPMTQLASMAAVLYEDGGFCDLLLAGLAQSFKKEGLRLAGVVQTNERYDALCACDMTLNDLTSGRDIRISQRLGRYARGCRLDSSALTEAVGLVDAGLSAGADLLILNKFGKTESSGGGFRPVIARALELGVPVLVGISQANLPAWMEFTGGEAMVLPPLDVAVRGWLHGLAAPERASA